MINYYVCNMKVTKYLPILAVCLMTTGCNSKKEAVLTSGIDLANLDTMAMPGTSFYQYACGRSEERRVGKECRSRWSPYH